MRILTKPRLFLAATLCLVTVANGASADSVVAVGTTPAPASGIEAVTAGSSVFLFGYGTQVFRFDPITETTTATSVVLPAEIRGASAVWTGSRIYLFGGTWGDVVSDSILEYDPTTDTAIVITAKLTTARRQTSAIWDGQNAYIFGGITGETRLRDVVRYNPSTDSTRTMTATFPTVREGTAAFWDGRNAYVVNGRDTSFTQVGQVVRYSPSTDRTQVMSATFARGNAYMAAVWAGGKGFIFGGEYAYLEYCHPAGPPTIPLPGGGGGGYGQYVDVDPKLTPDDHCQNNYVIKVQPVDDLLRYSLAPGAPANLMVTPTTTGLGHNLLTWEPPPSNSYSSPIMGYRVYRQTSSANPWVLLFTTGSNLRATDVSCPASYICNYKLSAFNADGEGPMSKDAAAPGWKP